MFTRTKTLKNVINIFTKYRKYWYTITWGPSQIKRGLGLLQYFPKPPNIDKYRYSLHTDMYSNENMPKQITK